MSDEFEQINHLPMLKEDQRVDAKQKARDMLLTKLGGEPLFEDYVRRDYSKYGPSVEAWIVRAMAFMLLSAFLVSAFHIYHVGSSTYREGIDSWWQAVVTGVALVSVAESAVLVLSVVPALWAMPRTMAAIMYGGAIAAAFIAAVGNIDVTITYTHAPFDWIKAWGASLSNDPKRFVLATMPPFLTLVVGQSLKYRLLDKAGQRYQAKAAYDEAMQDWRALVASIEDQSGWIATWANVLWDAWCHGKRRDLVAEITLDERRAIVLREMQADRWFEREFSGIQVNSKVNSGDPGVSAKQRVVDYLRAHPEIADQLADGEMQQSEVAHSLGVSQASVSRGLTAFSRNGHSEN